MIATNEELALLEKWKRKLCLQEWRIKLLTHLHPEEMMVRNAGATPKEATTLTQAFIAANIFGNQPKVGEDDHE